MISPDKMTIKTKLICGFILMLALLFLSSSISFLMMNSLVKKLRHTLDQDVQLAQSSGALLAYTLELGQQERDIILNIKNAGTKNGNTRFLWESEVSTMTNMLDIVMSFQKQMKRTDELAFANDAKRYLGKHTDEFRNLITNIETGRIRTMEEANTAFNLCINDELSMQFHIKHISRKAIGDLQKARESADTVANWSRILLLISTFVTVIIGAAVSLLVTFGIKTPLNQLVNNLRQANEQLVENNKELEQYQKTAEKDMHIAINVQQSILQTKPPVYDCGWDIDFTFIPKSGVSGDFYEFFMNNNNFHGVGLFDVSGHGISSGLITMLAKSVVNRNFIANLNDPVHKVMTKINADLIHELHSVDNYITGILLRITENQIEYVNAGHTELLIKRKNNPAIIVQPKGDDIKGNFLGVPAMDLPFRSISFKTIKDDSIILYSDCIIETVNPQGEAFGLERLISILDSFSGEYSSKDIVSRIASQLFSFAETDELGDDLTLIVMKKI